MIRHHILTKLLQEICGVQTKRISCGRRHMIRCMTMAAAGKQRDEESLASAKPFEDIPCFPILPFIGSAWIYMPFIGKYSMDKLQEANRHKKMLLGDIFREKFGKLNVVCSFRAEDMETVLRNEGPYPSRVPFSALKVYRESRKQWYSTTGIMLLEGKEWYDLRTKVQKHLLKPKAIQAYLYPMQDIAKDLVRRVLELRDNNKEVPGLLEELYKWAFESVAYVGLDTRLGCLRSGLTKDSDGMKMITSVKTQQDCLFKLDNFLKSLMLWKLFPTPTWKRFTTSADVFTELAFKYINRSLEDLNKNSDNEDKELTLLQNMLLTKGLDASKAMVTVADMLFAGIETTSHSVGYILYQLARNPQKQELLHQEISRLLPSKEDKITPEVFAQLKYLKACLKESWRLLPIVGGAARTLDRDIVISGYRVPAGTVIAVALQEIMLDKRYFKDPNTYYPERWLDKDNKTHPFAFLPFGFGTRSCIGRRLAELEIICLITELIRNFKVEYHHEDIGLIARRLLSPDKPLLYKFIER